MGSATTEGTMAKKKFRFPIIIEPDADGFFAQCPNLQGFYSQGFSWST